MDRFKFKLIWEVDKTKPYCGGFAKFQSEIICLGDKIPNKIDGFKLIRKLQSTGRKDNNNKLIYEGDVIGAIGIVIWKKEDAMFGFKPLNDDYSLTFEELSQGDEDFEIIGNLYENPELLTNNKRK